MACYEVVPVYGREPFRMPQHLARLRHGLDGVGMTHPMSDAASIDLVRALVAKQPFADQAVYFR